MNAIAGLGAEGVGRAFVALPCPPRLRAALADAHAGWRREGADIKWADPALAHLTLRFLGPASRAALVELDRRLGRIAGEAGPLAVSAGATGAFPDWRRPRVLWLGLEADGLAELARGVEEAARAAGFAPEERRFTPHLTLGRVRGPRGIARAVEEVRAWRPAARPETVAEIVLYRSELGSGGPRHTPIETYALTGRRTT